ncbi:MAG: class I SAM-dependent methyltransferase [Coleofasciculus sp. B1-GNL1-01]|uniref:class I SAM-dependent methyltransferase n=1 Tax=Coleofasciculus sp. B1-GNL1-01 TaxID=3068484 RepID=UPI0032FC1E7E
MNNFHYVGSELRLFSEAQNWKAYYASIIRQYLGSEVLEVGAGIGTTTERLCQRNEKRWICLEPDPVLVKILESSLQKNSLLSCCEIRNGIISDLSADERFDSILYIDVLEHIKDDINETRLAVNHLNKGGLLIILVPAYQWLYTPFDSSIGHYRRYNKNTLSKTIPSSLKVVYLNYLDCAGLLASISNRLILKSKMPNRRQILVWDRYMIPISRTLDSLILHSFGKSILGIWRKQ